MQGLDAVKQHEGATLMAVTAPDQEPGHHHVEHRMPVSLHISPRPNQPDSRNWTAPTPLGPVLFSQLFKTRGVRHVGTNVGKMDEDHLRRQHIKAPDPTEKLHECLR